MATSKASKKRRQPDSAAETLNAMESWGDRVVRWVTDNPAPILGTAVAILVVAGIYGLARQSQHEGMTEAAVALSEVQADYREAMGGTPGSIEVPEPANPETARRVRLETIEQYEKVASEYPGTAAAAIALLEAGKLHQALGDTDAASAAYEAGIGEVAADDPVRALLLTRLASVHEAAGRYAEAAATYEKAAAIDRYPLRWDALADAARLHAMAGNADAALAAQARIEAEAPDLRLAPYVEARLEELRREQSGS